MLQQDDFLVDRGRVVKESILVYLFAAGLLVFFPTLDVDEVK